MLMNAFSVNINLSSTERTGMQYLVDLLLEEAIDRELYVVPIHSFY